MSELRRRVQLGRGSNEFFFASLSGERLREEIFFLAYHLHWSRNDILALDVAERRTYVRMLAERIEVENKAAREVAEQLRRT